MLEQASILIFIVIALALIFDFVNGFHDTANAIATCVSTRAVSPAVAIIMSAILNFAGAMISTGVAKTIGGDIVQSASMVNEIIIIAALAGAIIWNLITWWFGMPSSSSHALVGGIIGAVIISVGFMGLNGYGILKIFLSLVLSPLAAMAIGWIILHIIFAICHSMRPATVNDNCNRLQVISAALMAFAHGSNDAQKSMGIITLALLSGGYIYRCFRSTYFCKNIMCFCYGSRYFFWWLENHQNCWRENLPHATCSWIFC